MSISNIMIQHFPKNATADAFDAIVVGAGFAGMYMLHRLRSRGLSVRAFERASDVGGVWYWNRYPGARCDIESMQYSYSFSDELQQEWRWSEKFAAQPEILRYASHVADRFGLRDHIQFDTTATSVTFDEDAGLWIVRTDRGDCVAARFLIAATGVLSVPSVPRVPGLEKFEGKVLYTSKWPHEDVDFTGQRVGIIGTGSSGVQTVPVVAEQAKQLTVFQRTANYCVPARNGPLNAEVEQYWKQNYPALRNEMRQSRRGWITLGRAAGGVAAALPETERLKRLQACWESGGFAFLAAFDDILSNDDVNKSAANFVARQIDAAVKDSQVARKLTPNDHPLGTKRMVVENGYFDAYNRSNVTLVDLKEEALVAAEPAGLRTQAGLYELDSLILATGFDAMTGALLNMNIRGRGGLELAEKWRRGPLNYLGLMVAGFPNLFMVTGPGSPSVLSNMMTAIEQHVEWIDRCIADLRKVDRSQIEATEAAEREWVQHVNEAAMALLYRSSSSWYLGSNVDGKPKVFMPYAGGADTYRERCEAVAANGYQGFKLSSAGDGVALKSNPDTVVQSV